MKTLQDYLNKYAGYRFVIVGKGVTPYDYANLSKLTDPIIFLNDAVLLESKATRSVETFMFAAHIQMKVLLNPKMTSTLVLPEGPCAQEPPNTNGIHNRGRLYAKDLDQTVYKNLVGYDWSGYCDETLLARSREDAAKVGILYKAGSVCQLATHFAWICGASEIAYIGCDGDNPPARGDWPYDKRLKILSTGRGLGMFPKIRKNQERECKLLKIDYTYVKEADLAPIIPRIAHFVWLGPKPNWLDDIVGGFKSHNPKWEVNVWTERPSAFTERLNTAWKGCEQLCQRADLLYCWLLYHYGGVTLNTDLIACKSFDPLRLVETWGSAWTTLHDGTAILTNGCMGAIRYSNAFSRCIHEIPRITPETQRRPRTRFGPGMLTRLFGPEGDDDMCILPWQFFYPWPWREREKARAFWKAPGVERDRMLKEKKIRPYAVHLWGIDGSSTRSI